MSRPLTASDRTALIRLASTMPVGTPERRAILAGLSRQAMEFDSQEALDKYLKDHPGADKSNHTVKKQDGGADASKPKKSRTVVPAGRSIKEIHGDEHWRQVSGKLPKKTVDKAFDLGAALLSVQDAFDRADSLDPYKLDNFAPDLHIAWEEALTDLTKASPDASEAELGKALASQESRVFTKNHPLRKTFQSIVKDVMGGRKVDTGKMISELEKTIPAK